MSSPIGSGLVFIVIGVVFIVASRPLGDHFRQREGAVRAPRSLYIGGLVGAGLVAIVSGIGIIVAG